MQVDKLSERSMSKARLWQAPLRGPSPSHPFPLFDDGLHCAVSQPFLSELGLRLNYHLVMMIGVEGFMLALCIAFIVKDPLV